MFFLPSISIATIHVQVRGADLAQLLLCVRRQTDEMRCQLFLFSISHPTSSVVQELVNSSDPLIVAV